MAAANIAIAAINDPFLLATDPVQMFEPIGLPVVPVPEPGTGILCALGIALLARRRPGSA